jgi:hypothetical protein
VWAQRDLGELKIRYLFPAVSHEAGRTALASIEDDAPIVTDVSVFGSLRLLRRIRIFLRVKKPPDAWTSPKESLRLTSQTRS